MLFLHFALVLFASIVIWLLSGVLIKATDRVAKRYKKPGFFVAFFILGFLTSISEISVATNSTLKNVPQVSAGNLVGASVVIFLLIIPLLAVVGGGIKMDRVITKENFRIFLFTILLPALSMLDGEVTRKEGLVIVVFYILLLYLVRKRKPVGEVVEATIQGVEEELMHKHKATLLDLGKVLIGGVLIFLAGKILVDEAVYFSQLFRIPSSFIGLLLLSIGTNIPELAIALRCIIGKHKNIAFGDYMGSAAANTFLLGILVLVNGRFFLERSEFIPTFIILLCGLVSFYIFAQSKKALSQKEGLMLLALYGIFLIVQIFNLTQFNFEGSEAVSASLFGLLRP